jgi:hypothetical protein
MVLFNERKKEEGTAHSDGTNGRQNNQCNPSQDVKKYQEYVSDSHWLPNLWQSSAESNSYSNKDDRLSVGISGPGTQSSDNSKKVGVIEIDFGTMDDDSKDIDDSKCLGNNLSDNDDPLLSQFTYTDSSGYNDDGNQ